MIMLELHNDHADDGRFLSLAEEIVAGAVVTHRPLEAYVFKIDHWFDHKWLGFSGKFLGAIGSWQKRLTVPPFVASRILAQRYWVRDSEGGYEAAEGRRDVHHVGPAEKNLLRTVKCVAPEAALFWYSGDTTETGRGSIMGYVPVGEDHWVWYVACERRDDWRVPRRKGIHEYEVRMFREAGAGVRMDRSGLSD
jgi:hypothetical protein